MKKYFFCSGQHSHAWGHGRAVENAKKKKKKKVDGEINETAKK
jgi:hypothetical protein